MHFSGWSRRQFLSLAGTGLAANLCATTELASIAPARRVIFILLAGGPSQIDTFDFKHVPGVTPRSMRPERIHGIVLPTGVLPMLSAAHVPDIAIVRSLRAQTLVHHLAQAALSPVFDLCSGDAWHALHSEPGSTSRSTHDSFEQACATAAANLEKADVIRIAMGGWDMHRNIYSSETGGIFEVGRSLDAGLAGLIANLKSRGLFDSTLIVAMGEFGRSVGRLSLASGRDHHPQHFALFAGAGVRGGRALGATNEDGVITDSGWRHNRAMNHSDVIATMDCALGRPRHLNQALPIIDLWS